jgi:hypothetical protein
MSIYVYYFIINRGTEGSETATPCSESQALAEYEPDGAVEGFES